MTTAEEKAFLSVAVAAIPRVAEIILEFPPDDRAGALETAERRFLAGIAATAEVDTHSGRHFFGLGLVLDEVGRKAKEIRITHGSREEISNDLGGSSSTITIDIGDVVSGLRKRARPIGVDLSGPFFYPPRHPAFEKIIAEFVEERERRVARLRRDKKKLARHKALMRSKNIKAAEPATPIAGRGAFESLLDLSQR